MSHLRLHNGTIWRWSRPLIGFDYDGIPHLRIEQRVVSGGPTILDAIANAALFFGLMRWMMTTGTPLEAEIPFSTARDNFYASARYGLDAHVTWVGGKKGSVRSLILDELLPRAREGLIALEIDANDIERYLNVIELRVQTRRTGAAWQRQRVAAGDDMTAMTEAYYQQQKTGRPVHEWDL